MDSQEQSAPNESIGSTATDSSIATVATDTRANADKKTSTVAVGLVVLVVVLAAAGFWWFTSSNDSLELGVAPVGTVPVPAIEPVTGTVATVNGVEIVADEYNNRLQQIASNYAAQGVDLQDESVLYEVRAQTIDTLINTELLLQAAQVAAISVSQEDVDAAIADLQERIGGAELLEQRAAEFGMSIDDLRQDLEEELQINSFLIAETNDQALAVSAEEIETRYNELAADSPGAPSLDELRPQIEGQLIAEKQRTELQRIIDDLIAAADIEITVES